MMKDKLQTEIDEFEEKLEDLQKRFLEKDTQFRSLLLNLEDPEFLLNKAKEVMQKDKKFLESLCEALMDPPFDFIVNSSEKSPIKLDQTMIPQFLLPKVKR